MKVATIIQLAASGELKLGGDLQVEGIVTWKGEPKTLAGTSNGRAWSFVAQKVLLKDDPKADAGIMVDVAYPDGSIGMQSTGHLITATGKLGSYKKGDETKWTVERAKILEERGAGEPKQPRDEIDEFFGKEPPAQGLPKNGPSINEVRQAVKGNGNGYGKSPDEQARICRQNALSAAAALYAAGGRTEWDEQSVLETAAEFAAWTITGELVRQEDGIPI